jgi:hypothetical protein
MNFSTATGSSHHHRYRAPLGRFSLFLQMAAGQPTHQGRAHPWEIVGQVSLDREIPPHAACHGASH